MNTIVINTCDPVGRPARALSTWDGKSYGASKANYPGMIWEANGNILVRPNISEPQQHPGCYLELGPDTDPTTALASLLKRPEDPKTDEDWIVERLNIPPGSYFPRMARPHHQHPGDLPGPLLSLEYAHEKAAAATQAISLARRLTKTFSVVDPDPKNMKVFGAEFREIIILAATEFEAQAKGILRANSYGRSLTGENLSTKDYVKIEPALRLADYAMTFDRFPWIDPVAPFEHWNSDLPTQSLRWYNAYNLVKHDREQNFTHATMENAIAATSAVVILGVAQFGYDFLRRNPSLLETFTLKSYPSWSIGDTHGLIGAAGARPTPINYPFD